ncbi:hypothetical protein TELCIR_13977 [Teladorsagia circumcincta]|uniref:Uncharacterized protein n=1 Tax=Teladorsagia circumcincta TaxID=45464 RepID=A0A2G9U2A2_TELCI|nr:hypothetical protein TELCIR_13977 [Teladorsagia circumcincta]
MAILYVNPSILHEAKRRKGTPAKEQSEVERILSDHEKTIQELFAQIKDIREECLYQERYREDVSAKKICNALKTLSEQFSELRETLHQERTEMTTEETQTDDEHLVPMEVEAVVEESDRTEREDEQARIMENLDYLEAIEKIPKKSRRKKLLRKIPKRSRHKQTNRS